MELIKLEYDYGLIPESDRDEVRSAALSIKPRIERSVSDMLAIGESLLEVKALLPHGQWLPWLDVEFSMTPRTAQRLMNAAERWRGKCETVSHLGLSVIYALEDASDSAVEELVERAKSGERITRRDVPKRRKPKVDIQQTVPEYTREQLIQILVESPGALEEFSSFAGRVLGFTAVVTAVVRAIGGIQKTLDQIELVTAAEKREALGKDFKARSDRLLGGKKPRDPKKLPSNFDEEGFEKFWSAYPRKTAKENARFAYLKAIADVSLDEMIAKAEVYAKYVEATGTEVCHAATWLNQKRWQDELKIPRKKGVTTLSGENSRFLDEAHDDRRQEVI
ncbi:MAG: DUF3102 domain-containing protein [Planctomycetaceae bacterium]